MENFQRSIHSQWKRQPKRQAAPLKSLLAIVAKRSPRIHVNNQRHLK